MTIVKVLNNDTYEYTTNGQWMKEDNEIIDLMTWRTMPTHMRIYLLSLLIFLTYMRIVHPTTCFPIIDDIMLVHNLMWKLTPSKPYLWESNEAYNWWPKKFRHSLHRWWESSNGYNLFIPFICRHVIRILEY